MKHDTVLIKHLYSDDSDKELNWEGKGHTLLQRTVALFAGNWRGKNCLPELVELSVAQAMFLGLSPIVYKVLTFLSVNG
jgi:hypothetical protein